MNYTTSIKVDGRDVAITFDLDNYQDSFSAVGWGRIQQAEWMIQKASYSMKKALIADGADSYNLETYLRLKGEGTGRIVTANEVIDSLEFLRRFGITFPSLPTKGLAKASATIVFDEQLHEKLGKKMAQLCGEDPADAAPIRTLEEWTIADLKRRHYIDEQQSADLNLD